MNDAVREPIVAGMFYPASHDHLESALDGFVGTPAAATTPFFGAPVGLIAPHAGYVYSGKTAGRGYQVVATLGRPEVVLVLGANHTGLGPALCVDDRAAWRTPIGEMAIDRQIVASLVDGLGMATDRAPFEREHSIEVQLPFLQHLWGDDVTLVPILVQPTRPDVLSEAALGIGQVVKACRSVLLVASSDFTHYEPDGVARSLDREALDLILAGDPDRFLTLCQRERRSICGAGAITLLLHLSGFLGLDEARLIDYATSGDITGDRDAVVGYASVTFFGRHNG